MTKAPDAFRTISEVADDLDLPQHVLRFWETKFAQIKPMKRGGGRRYYRPEDVDLLRGIRHLLYDEGYTIRGLQRIFKEQGNRFVVDVGRGEFDEMATIRPQRGDLETEQDTPPAASEPRPGKQAVPVSELTQPRGKGKLLDKWRPGMDEDASGPGRAMTSEDRRSLQATLYELLECKRLLDQVRGD